MIPTSHDDLVLLTAWLADRGYDGRSVAHAVEIPHDYQAEFALASAVRDHLRDNPDHRYLMTNDLMAYCDGRGDGVECPWTVRWDEATGTAMPWLLAEPATGEPQQSGGGWLVHTEDGLSAWGVTAEAAEAMITRLRRQRMKAED